MWQSVLRGEVGSPLKVSRNRATKMVQYELGVAENREQWLFMYTGRFMMIVGGGGKKARWVRVVKGG